MKHKTKEKTDNKTCLQKKRESHLRSRRKEAEKKLKSCLHKSTKDTYSWWSKMKNLLSLRKKMSLTCLHLHKFLNVFFFFFLLLLQFAANKQLRVSIDLIICCAFPLYTLLSLLPSIKLNICTGFLITCTH